MNEINTFSIKFWMILNAESNGVAYFDECNSLDFNLPALKLSSHRTGLYNYFSC
jgi:hypothetical protein